MNYADLEAALDRLSRKLNAKEVGVFFDRATLMFNVQYVVNGVRYNSPNERLDWAVDRALETEFRPDRQDNDWRDGHPVDFGDK